MFSDFNKIQQNAKKNGEQARLMSEPGVSPEVGGVYTISADFVCGDRSYTDRFIKVIARTGESVLVHVHEGYINKPILLRVEDRYWYDAKEAFDAYIEATSGDSQ